MNNKIYNISGQKLMRIIFENPTYRFHIRELARLTKLNPNTIINISNALEKQGLIKKEKRKHLTEIYANIENKDFIIKKRIFNILQLYNSELVDFLIKKYSPEAISVIGSYSRGEDMEKSDIDIAVISDKKESIDIEKFEKILNRKIHLLALNYKDISDEFYTNLINGIILYGYIKIK